MERLLDQYTITGADEGATYAGRGYNAGVGQWQSFTSGATFSSGRPTKYQLRDADIVVHDSTGAIKLGVLVMVYVINDATNMGLCTPWFVGVTSKARLPYWEGKRPMNAGFFWRVHRGGLVAGDIVSMGVGYD